MCFDFFYIKLLCFDYQTHKHEGCFGQNYKVLDCSASRNSKWSWLSD